jgi:hypothetical protein
MVRGRGRRRGARAGEGGGRRSEAKKPRSGPSVHGARKAPAAAAGRGGVFLLGVGRAWRARVARGERRERAGQRQNGK